MRRVSSAEFVRRFSALCDEALNDPVVLTRNGRDRLIVVGIDHYKHLLSLALLHSDDAGENAQISDELGFIMRPGGAKSGQA